MPARAASAKGQEADPRGQGGVRRLSANTGPNGGTATECQNSFTVTLLGTGAPSHTPTYADCAGQAGTGQQRTSSPRLELARMSINRT